VFLTTVAYPLKGTGYYNDVAGKLISIGDWARTTDRDLRVEGRHSRRYYGYADALLRAPSEAAAATAREGLRASYHESEV
jgi:hypothetical protein